LREDVPEVGESIHARHRTTRRRSYLSPAAAARRAGLRRRYAAPPHQQSSTSACNRSDVPAALRVGRSAARPGLGIAASNPTRVPPGMLAANLQGAAKRHFVCFALRRSSSI
jgi:hypothetical protein